MTLPDSLQYIALMAGCLLLTLPLEFVFGARVYRRPVRLAQAVLVTLLVFSVWDAIAISAGLWTYSQRFTSGIIVAFGLPLEEIIFFIAIPICGILTYEAVGRVFHLIRTWARRHQRTQGDVR